MAKKRKAESSQDQSSKVDFEDAISEVEEIVNDLEGGHLGLNESLTKYELGISRLKRCHELLQQAERKVELLSGVDSDGNAISEPFPGLKDDANDTQSHAGPPTRASKANDSSEVDDFPGLF